MSGTASADGPEPPPPPPAEDPTKTAPGAPPPDEDELPWPLADEPGPEGPPGLGFPGITGATTQLP
ncbi:MAG TPA: hypothetical protein VG266_02890 [Candidatus Dormibacteraeota bacterium]|jgi:hypothetical protein|nr:hypothetical protein [Candidatus Dormibacteraeota bacterium]